MTPQTTCGRAVPQEAGAPDRTVAAAIRFLPKRRFSTQGFQGRRCGRGEQGAAMVEMALSMVILMTIIFGVLFGCLALYSYHFVSDAAREGSRYAIVHGATCTVSGASCTVSTAQIQTYVQDLGFPGINPSAMTVNTTYSAYPAGATCAALGCNGPGDLATVTAQYTFHLNIPFLPAQTLNMTSTSAMVISQ